MDGLAGIVHISIWDGQNRGWIFDFGNRGRQLGMVFGIEFEMLRQAQNDIGTEVVAGGGIFFVGISQTDKGFHRTILPKSKEKRLQTRERVKVFL